MSYELADLKAEQAKANAIIDFKTYEEKELAKDIQEAATKAASSYSDLRDSIVGYKASKSRAVEKIKKGIEQSLDPLESRRINAQLIKASKKEIIDNALRIVCDNLIAQTAAIFLISKDGKLERIGMYGRDKLGKPLKDSWFSEESYEIGESFTGRAAEPKPGSRYGEIQYTQDLSNERLKAGNEEKYCKKFGSLRCAIAIPLNGRNKTYGVLRVINKIDDYKLSQQEDKNISLSSESFSIDDVRLLLFLASSIANALSNFRRDIQTQIFKYLSHLLIQSPRNDNNFLGDFCQQVIDLLVQNSETAFKAGIFRVKDSNSEVLSIKSISLAVGVTDNRDDSPRKTDDDGFLWLVVENQKRLILQNIQEKHIDKFKNENWIKENNFQSFGCFPLIAKGETVGTLSLYTGYKYEFYPDSVDFLQGIADLMASFILKVKLEEREQELQESISPSSGVFRRELRDTQIESRFKILVEEWRCGTKNTLSLTQKFMHPAYQQIIGFGSSALPFLFKELDQYPDHWFWALKAITGSNSQYGNLAAIGRNI